VETVPVDVAVFLVDIVNVGEDVDVLLTVLDGENVIVNLGVPDNKVVDVWLFVTIELTVIVGVAELVLLPTRLLESDGLAVVVFELAIVAVSVTDRGPDFDSCGLTETLAEEVGVLELCIERDIVGLVDGDLELRDEYDIVGVPVDVFVFEILAVPVLEDVVVLDILVEPVEVFVINVELVENGDDEELLLAPKVRVAVLVLVAVFDETPVCVDWKDG
jgi:hypothetical protein